MLLLWFQLSGISGWFTPLLLLLLLLNFWCHPIPLLRMRNFMAFFSRLTQLAWGLVFIVLVPLLLLSFPPCC